MQPAKVKIDLPKTVVAKSHTVADVKLPPPVVHPKVEPKIEPKFEPKIEPRPMLPPKIDPKNPPKVDPKIDPKNPPKVDPKNPPARACVKAEMARPEVLVEIMVTAAK